MRRLTITTTSGRVIEGITPLRPDEIPETGFITVWGESGVGLHKVPVEAVEFLYVERETR